jgi:YD repeat-containing protein
MRIVRLLVGRPPASISDLMRILSVTRTAITDQLNELIQAGYVERTIQRLPQRGRPRHMYRVTPAALLTLFADSQQIVAPAIWKAIAEIGGSELVKKVVQRVSQDVIHHYSSRIAGATIEERLHQLTGLLNEEGHIVEVGRDEQGRLVLRRRNCQFASMFEDMRSVCRVDLSVLGAVLQANVRQTKCRHDGAPCCTFEVASQNGKGP